MSGRRQHLVRTLRPAALLAVPLLAVLLFVIGGCAGGDGSMPGSPSGIAAQAGSTTPAPTATATPEPLATATPALRSYGVYIARDGVLPTPTPAPTPTPPPADIRTSGTLGGLTFWGGGDSTSLFMNQALAAAFRARGSPAATVAYYGADGRPFGQSSGLANPGFFDWPGHIVAEMARLDPDVAVFMIGANDAWIGTAGETARANYAGTVGSTMDLLAGDDRIVLWVGMPNMARADLQARLPALNAIYAAQASQRPRVYYVDAWAATSDGNGNYTATLTHAEGAPVAARASDGVHFTTAGAAILADAVLEVLAQALAAR